MVKNQPAIQEMQVRSLGWEDPLEKEMLPTPVFLPGELYGFYSPWGRKESDTTEQLSLFLLFSNGRIHIWSRKVLVVQLCPTFCDLMDCRSPGSSVNGIFQARILEWVVISFPRGSS